MNKPLLIAVQGPTASGKTKVSLQLAEWLNTEVVSCDSRQFYKELKIGAAPPTAEELAGAKHHFIQHLSVEKGYNAGDFEKDALAVLDDIFINNKMAILVGGSGLYANAVLFGMDDFPTVNPEIRQKLNDDFAQHGLSFLQNQLNEKDPVYFEEVDRENPVRLIRALEVIAQTGQPFSAQRKKKKADRPFKMLNFVMDWPREELYKRINLRVDVMMENGLLAEAKSLLPFRNLQPLNTVGYKELFDYFDGKTDLETAVSLIKQNTRRFAKRQLTWLRRDENAIWVHPTEIEKMKEIIANKMEQ